MPLNSIIFDILPTFNHNKSVAFEPKKPDTKECVLHNSTHEVLKLAELADSDRNYRTVLVWGRGQGTLAVNRHKETFGGRGSILYL